AVTAVVPEAVPGLRLEDGGQVARVVEYPAGAGPVLRAPPMVDHLHQRLPEVRQCNAVVFGAEPGRTPNPGENSAYGALLLLHELVQQVAGLRRISGMQDGAELRLPWSLECVRIAGAACTVLATPTCPGRVTHRSAPHVGVGAVHRMRLRFRPTRCDSGDRPVWRSLAELECVFVVVIASPHTPRYTGSRSARGVLSPPSIATHQSKCASVDAASITQASREHNLWTRVRRGAHLQIASCRIQEYRRSRPGGRRRQPSVPIAPRR